MALRVALIQAPAWGTACPPYGIAVLKSYLASKGHEVKTWDLNLEFYLAADEEFKGNWAADRHPFWMDPERVHGALEDELADVCRKSVAAVAAFKPDVVGFTILYSNQQVALALAERLKEACPGVIVVLGGPQASLDADGANLAMTPAVDFVAQGEGEATFSELLEALEKGTDPLACKGLLFRRDGKMVSTGARPLIADLASLPPADFTDFPMDGYTDEGCIPVSLSRGCPNKCVFCYEVQYWDRFRVRKADSLISEVSGHYAILPAVHTLWFHDSLVNGHMGELKKFAQGLLDAKIHTRWSAQAIIRKEMTRDVLKLLKDSGCYCLNYGLEAASFTTMLRMGKVLAKDSDLDQIVRDTHELGIDTILNFMFGFPGETESDFQESLDFVKRNKDYITMVQPSPGFCDFYKGTEGYKHPEKFDIELREGSAHWSSKDGTNTYLTRMERFERFLDLVYSLGVKCSYPREVFLKNTIIANYHFSYGKFEDALPYYEKADATEPYSETTQKRLLECLERVRGITDPKAKALRRKLDPSIPPEPAPDAFKLARLLDPEYRAKRLSQITSWKEFAWRALNLGRYLFGLAWNAYFGVRGKVMYAWKLLRDPKERAELRAKQARDQRHLAHRQRDARSQQ